MILGAFAAVAAWDGLKKTQQAGFIGVEPTNGYGISLPYQVGQTCDDMLAFLDIYPHTLQQRGDIAVKYAETQSIYTCDTENDSWQNRINANIEYSSPLPGYYQDINAAITSLQQDLDSGVFDDSSACAAAKLLAAPPRNTYQLQDFNQNFNKPTAKTREAIHKLTHPWNGKCSF